MYAFKNLTLYEEQRLYVDCQDYKGKQWDCEYQGKLDEAQDWKNKIPFSDLLYGPMYQDAWPSLNAFPFWDVRIGKDKESKMFLCDLQVPSNDLVSEYTSRLEKFLSKYAPDTIQLPTPEQCYKPGSHKYYDQTEIKSDSQMTSYSDGPFLYQSFMTGPLTVREVWLPTKGYKCSSNWWHSLTYPILKRVDGIILDESDDEVVKIIKDRIIPSKTIDLKGCGLQFPREYILATMHTLGKLYPSEEMDEQIHIAEKLFSNISILKDKEYLYPKRGVGLGYYTNLMVLVTASILDEYDFVARFVDDMLIDADSYDDAIDELENFLFVINTEKSGVAWNEIASFISLIIFPDEEEHAEFSLNNAELAAMVTKRYHWERKAICNLLPDFMTPYVAYHYERIFGWEFFPSECLLHPQNNGLNKYRSIYKGYDTLQDFGKYLFPKPLVKAEKLPFTDFNWEDISPADKKKHHLKRKMMFRSREKCYSWDYEYLHPQIEEVGYAPAQNKADRSYPSWADELSVKEYHLVSRKTRFDLTQSELLQGIEECPLSLNPLHAYASGGYKILTGDHFPWRIPDETREILTKIAGSEIKQPQISIKSDILESLWKKVPIRAKKAEAVEYRNGNLLANKLLGLQTPVTRSMAEVQATISTEVEAYESDGEQDLDTLMELEFSSSSDSESDGNSSESS
jgi:hypothetical protein